MCHHFMKIIGAMILVAVLAGACQTAPATRATQTSMPEPATALPTPRPDTQTPAPAPATPTMIPELPTVNPATPTRQVFIFDTPTATRMLFTPTSTPVPPDAVWSFQTKGAIWGIPTVSDGQVFIGSDDGNLYAVDARTGKLTWQFATQGIVRSRPAIDNNQVYVASDDGYLYAIDAQKGTQTWRTDIGNALARDVREKLGLSPSPSGFDYKQCSPVVAEGKVFVGSFDGNI